MTTRAFMLVYDAGESIREMTAEATRRVLHHSDAELTVAFNGGGAFPLEAHERLTVVAWPERLSLGVAYNRLVAAARERFICLLHNDCFVPAGFLPPLIEQADRSGFAFPRVTHDATDCARRGVTETSDLLPPSCCYVASRQAWVTLRGFDESFAGCHFEDMDLFLRAKQSGYELARVDSVEVFHKRGVTRAMVAGEANQAFRINRAAYAAKWGVDGQAPLPSIELGGQANG